MDRRIDEKTADRINQALLTRAAFDTPAALRFAHLSGLATALVTGVFARAPQRVRPHMASCAPDRRTVPRRGGAA